VNSENKVSYAGKTVREPIHCQKMEKSESADAALWSTMVPLSVVKALLTDALLPLKAIPALLEQLINIKERKVSLLVAESEKIPSEARLSKKGVTVIWSSPRKFKLVARNVTMEDM